MDIASKAEKPFVKASDAARALGVTAATIRNAVRRGDLPAIRLGRHILVSREALDQLIESADQATSVA